MTFAYDALTQRVTIPQRVSADVRTAQRFSAMLATAYPSAHVPSLVEGVGIEDGRSYPDAFAYQLSRQIVGLSAPFIAVTPAISAARVTSVVGTKVPLALFVILEVAVPVQVGELSVGRRASSFR